MRHVALIAVTSIAASLIASDVRAVRGVAGGAEPRVAPPAAVVAAEIQLLAPTNSTGAFAGLALAVDGDFALIGAPNGAIAGPGRVYVCERAGTWSCGMTLTNPDAAVNGSFGASVALQGDVAIIGAPTVGGASDGAAYRFVRAVDGSWSGEALERPATATRNFGASVAVSDQWIVVSSVGTDSMAGAAFVYPRSGVGPVELVAAGNQPGSRFGASVSVSGDTALIGGPEDDQLGMNAGAAFTFVFGGSDWMEGPTLFPDAGAQARFGASVAIGEAGERALVGAPGDISGAGAVYAFERSADSWPDAMRTRITPEDAANTDGFGASVALRGEHAAVGAPRSGDIPPDRTDGGGAYLFARRAGAWTEVARFELESPANRDQLGAAVALGADVVFAGAPARTENTGLVGVFEFPFGQGEPCVADDRCESAFCIDGVCCDGACGDGATDDCVACSVAQGAASDGVCGAANDTLACESECGAGTCGAGVCNAGCPDAGASPDGGDGPMDAGASSGPVQISGCKCGVAGGTPLSLHGRIGLALLALIALRRRR